MGAGVRLSGLKSQQCLLQFIELSLYLACPSIWLIEAIIVKVLGAMCAFSKYSSPHPFAPRFYIYPCQNHWFSSWVWLTCVHTRNSLESPSNSCSQVIQVKATLFVVNALCAKQRTTAKGNERGVKGYILDININKAQSLSSNNLETTGG